MPQGVGRIVTLKEIAAEAGVSVITVSRVVNGSDKVKPRTRGKIEEAMKKLGYTPNPAAKALVSGRLGTADIYIPQGIDLSNPFFMQFIAGASEALSSRMYSFLILRSREVEHACDGYIATGLLKDEIEEMYRYAASRGRPLILFGHTDIPELDWIDTDNFAGAKEMTGYLLRQGHTKIMMINATEEKDYAVDRLAGFREAILERELVYGDQMVLYAENSVQGGYDAAKSILKGQSLPTAVFCASDTLALGVIRAVTEAGLRVPQQLSVAGFDGLGHHLLSNPRITTVRQPVFEIGRMLGETLLSRIDGSKKSTRRLVEPELIIEASVTSPDDE